MKASGTSVTAGRKTVDFLFVCKITTFDARMFSKNRVFLVLFVHFIGFGEMLV